ncbi:FAD/NAD(P)-binding protein [Antarcticirhabdus aurantiaca]|uniref:FAD/NAD(P)-binding protein n=1 Tax=Antarcticirhabdus aurantiaca TaxID=2606717 RepID=A0ACD4NML8_9HYPH|nr:FAD/NAD(P)-binding protein [Antarcticirhabdus aurantiaca]WAJ28113.1 FAD/NAD(P)-binding protein [Jeongeuplla avenae]
MNQMAVMKKSGIAPADIVAIVGGGFAGAAVAFHLARAGQPSVVIEPRPVLGGGLAYSTADPSHRINVPAARMSLVPDEPDHFVRWLARTGALRSDAQALRPNGDAYPRRAVFGRYVAEHLAPFRRTGLVRHVEALACRIRRLDDRAGWRIEPSSGEAVEAGRLVLAATHPLPALPRALGALHDSDALVGNPYAAGALERIGRNASVLILGSGLTAADMVASLDAAGHRGPITMLSRRGLRSRGHAPRPAEPFGDFSSEPARDVPALLASIRTALANARAEGLSWHPVFDALRNQGSAIWAALPPAERARLVSRLRPFWDVHRFRIAPQVEAVLDGRVANGTLRQEAGRVLSAAPAPGGRIAITWRPRGRALEEAATFDAVINTTGPAHGEALARNPALRSLAAAGFIGPDPYGLGIATSLCSRAIDAANAPVPDLFVAGPLARGTFGELMGLPEVSRHAEAVAAEILASLADPAIAPIAEPARASAADAL